MGRGRSLKVCVCVCQVGRQQEIPKTRTTRMPKFRILHDGCCRRLIWQIGEANGLIRGAAADSTDYSVISIALTQQRRTLEKAKCQSVRCVMVASVALTFFLLLNAAALRSGRIHLIVNLQ